MAQLWSRRTVALRAPAAVAATVALAAGCTSAEHAVAPVPTDIEHMDAFAYGMWRRLVEVMLPVVSGGTLIEPAKLPVLRHVDALLAGLDDVARAQLADGLKLLHYGSVVFGLHLRPFLALDDAAATAYLRRVESTGIAALRGLMQVLKQFVYTSYWQEPATWAPIGYGGPVTAPLGIPRQGASPLPPDDMP